MVDQSVAVAYPTDDAANVLPMDTATTTTAVISASDEISHEMLEPPSVYDIGMYALNLYETLAFLMPLMISDRYQSVSKSELTTTFWLFVATNVRILISLKHSAGASEGRVWGLPPTEKLPPWLAAWADLLRVLVCIPSWNGRILREQP